MSRTYKVRVTNAEHEAMQGICDSLNAKLGEVLWRPDNLTLYLLVRALELIEEDAHCVQRFFFEPTKYDYRGRFAE